MSKNKLIDLVNLSEFKKKIISLIPSKTSQLQNDSGFKTTDTTYEVVSKTANGLAPKLPNETTTTKYLRQDGTWATPPNTTYSNFVKSGSGAKAGLVPSPGTTAGTTKYLREDGTWQVPPDTNTTYNAASEAPKAAGTATVGTSAKYAREDHVHPLQTTVSGSSGSCTGNAATATKLATARYIDGVSFNGSADIVHYGTCDTAAATAAKVVACTGFALKTGGVIRVKFTVTNTASNPTLNVNNTGAKAVYYRGAAISAGYLAAKRVYEFVYDGTNYELIGDVDTNSTYTAASATPKANGTATVGTST